MADTTVSDALVWPQDDGSGVPDGSEDYDSAGYLSLLAKYSGDSSYIGLDENGDPTLQFANVDTTNEEVDINTGFAYIMDGTHVVQSGSQTTYDTTLPNNTPYVVILPTTVTNLTLDTDATNDIWLAVDPTANDSVYLRHGTGLSAPSDPSVKIGTVNTSSGDTTRANDGPTQNVRTVVFADTGTDPSINGEFERNGNDVKVYSGGGVRNLTDVGAGALTDSGSDTGDGGDVYQLPQVEDAIDLQSGGEIQNADSVTTEEETITSAIVRGWGATDGYQDYQISEFADIGAAINQAFTDGAIALDIPKGDFTFTTTITPTQPFVMRGCGGKSNTGTDLQYDGSGTAIDGTANSVGGSVIQDIHLVKLGTAGVGTGIAQGGGGMTLRSCRVRRFNSGWSIPSDGYYSVSVNSLFNDCTNGIDGGCNALAIIGGATNANSQYGINITNDCRATVIRGGMGIEANGSYGVRIGAAEGPVTIAGNYFEANTTGGVVATAGDDVKRPVIHNNFFNNNGTRDVYLTRVVGGSVHNNHFHGPSSTSIGVELSADATEISVQSPGTIDGPATPITDNGTRTLIGGIGESSGDPTTTGQWNGNGAEGRVVVDTTNGTAYHYRGGSWV